MTGTKIESGFRPEIQALRAVAVLLVIGFHLWPDRLAGGYVGVDVFFVISGYLITAHLLREVKQTGTIGVTAFWARRIRRLLPAAFTVLAACFVMTAVWVPKALWQQTFSEIAASAAYGVNWVLALNSVDYQASGNSASIVQHYWSLSVEEQFYILWPLLIVGALALAAAFSRRKLFGAAASEKRNSRAILIMLAVVVALSFTVSVVLSYQRQSFAYFITPTRAWEFAAGGLLVFVSTKRPAAVSANRWNQIRLGASWLGLAAVAYSALRFDDKTVFPGYLALVPVVGAALIIWAGTVDHSWSPMVLGSFAPVQWVGTLSYSMYLWHWPLVVVYPLVRGFTPDIRGGIAILAATILLAAATKYFVEDPVRTGAFWRVGRRRAYAFAAGGIAVTLGVTGIGWNYTQSLYDAARTPQPEFANLASLTAELDSTLAANTWSVADQPAGLSAQVPEWIDDNCLSVSTKNLDSCAYGDAGSAHLAVLIGDSYAVSYLPAIRNALEPMGWRIQVLTYGQCPIADVPVHEWGLTTEYVRCAEHRQWANDQIASLNPDLILGASATKSTLSRLMSGNSGSEAVTEWKDGLAQAAANLSQLDRPVVIISGAVEANCTVEARGGPASCKASNELVEDDRVRDEEEITRAAGLSYLDTRSWFCSARRNICPEQIGPTLVRAETGHLTGGFSARLGLIMRAALVVNAPGVEGLAASAA